MVGRPPAGAHPAAAQPAGRRPAHLLHDLRRLTGAGRGDTVLVVVPEAAGAPLLERVQDARRRGATVLALDGGAPAGAGAAGGPGGPGGLGELAHERLAVGTAAEGPFDLAQHLVSVAAGQRTHRRSVRDRLARLAERLTSTPAISRW